MDIDTDDHGEEGVVFPGVDAHIMKMVIIEHPVINPFAGSTVVVDHSIFLRASGHRSIEPDIPVRFCVDTPAIGRWGTFSFAGAGIHFATGKGTAPFTGMLLFTVSPVGHTETSHAHRSAVFVNGDGIRYGFRSATVAIQVNEGAYLPFPAKLIGGIVVIGGVQTKITERDIRIDGLKFPEGNDSADTIVPPGTQETDMEREVNPNV